MNKREKQRNKMPLKRELDLAATGKNITNWGLGIFINLVNFIQNLEIFQTNKQKMTRFLGRVYYLGLTKDFGVRWTKQQ